MTARMLAGVVAANLAAPCLLILSVFLATFLTDPARLDASDGADMLVVSGIFLLMSWTGMAVSVFPASLLVAWLSWCSGWRSAWIYAATGASMGAVFGATIPRLILGSDEQQFTIIALYGGLGAICGWIYWRIAIRQTPEASRPITTS